LGLRPMPPPLQALPLARCSVRGYSFLRGREWELAEYRVRYVPPDRVPAWAAVGWTPISAPFRWSTWTGQPLGEMVIVEWERSEKPKEPTD
jgi:hypothetical protein